MLCRRGAELTAGVMTSRAFPFGTSWVGGSVGVRGWADAGVGLVAWVTVFGARLGVCKLCVCNVCLKIMGLVGVQQWAVPVT